MSAPPLAARPLHAWDLAPAAARAVQRQLAALVETRDRLGEVHRVAGVDVAFPRRADGRMARAAAVLLGFPDLVPLAAHAIEEPVRYPYIPGLLSFREAPAILRALEQLPVAPDLLLVDGQGRAHPRRFGIACHLGVLLDRPAIGCAKSRLVGAYEEPPPVAGAWTPLRDGDEVIGAVVRTRPRARPLFVSVGHRVSLETAVALVLACCRGHRLPEPVRRADALTRQLAPPL
ncbi:MAG TPA: deoxyribonuclease V [Chloroflexota bacterium]|nr:deoxyribonuclease V [Chloroflexota bacterium]